MRCVALATVLIAGWCASAATGEDAESVPALRLSPGSSLELMVITGPGPIATCTLAPPSGAEYQLKPDNNAPDRVVLRKDTALSGCSASVTELSSDDDGLWRLYSVNEQGNVTEHVMDIVVAEPEIPVQYLKEETYKTTIGDNVTARVNLVGSRQNLECRIILPDGMEMRIGEETVRGVRELSDPAASCAVTVEVVDESYIGLWYLVAKESVWHSDIEERKLPFNIYVEEIVEASPPGQVTVAEGNNFHLQLLHATTLSSSCRLRAPHDLHDTRVLKQHDQHCAFTVTNVTRDDAGLWNIVYGDKIVYRAQVELRVKGKPTSADHLELTVEDGASIDVQVGPEDAVYCELESPEGAVVGGFGPCRLQLGRADRRHAGRWLLRYAGPGQVLLETMELEVVLEDPIEQSQHVSTQYQWLSDGAELRCSVGVEVAGCKFRSPGGRVLVAAAGVGQGGIVAGGSANECVVRVPQSAAEAGTWRCALLSNTSTSYGFISLPCAPEDKKCDKPSDKPSLVAAQPTVSVLSDESAALLCRARQPLRYCYFVSNNGTYVTPSSDESSPYRLAGAGLPAGECGVRVRGAGAAGAWTCVAAPRGGAEMRGSVQVVVNDELTAKQYISKDGHLIVEAVVFGNRDIDYCRFVRNDGLGFPHWRPPAGYKASSRGCVLSVARPAPADYAPWRVAAGLATRGSEVHATAELQYTMVVRYYWASSFPMIMMIVSLIVLVVAALSALMSQNGRTWTRRRITVARQSITSFRYSFRKKPLPAIYDKDTPYAVAA